MGCDSQWITDIGGTVQTNIPNKVATKTNQLFYNKGKIYLVPRNTVTDNYTTPFGINKTKWDARPSHLHDICCKYHQVIIVNLPIEVIYSDYLYTEYDNTVKQDVIRCKDIPIEYLELLDVDFNTCNNLLYEAMIALGTIPKSICKLYRLGVNFNINWLFTNNNLLYINTIYNNKLYT